MATYRINYSQVISQANAIEDLADDLRRKVSDLSELQVYIRKEWVGMASSAFQTKLSELISDMQRTKSDMESVASTIKTVARRIQEADERAARRAREKLKGKQE